MLVLCVSVQVKARTHAHTHTHTHTHTHIKHVCIYTHTQHTQVVLVLAAITWDAVDWFMLRGDRDLDSCLKFSQVRFDVVCARYLYLHTCH